MSLAETRTLVTRPKRERCPSCKKAIGVLDVADRFVGQIAWCCSAACARKAVDAKRDEKVAS